MFSGWKDGSDMNISTEGSASANRDSRALRSPPRAVRGRFRGRPLRRMADEVRAEIDRSLGAFDSGSFWLEIEAFDDGMAILYGFLECGEDRGRASAAAARVPSVRRISNRVAILRP